MILRNIIFSLLLLSVAACSGTQAKIQGSLNRSQMSDVIGKNYNNDIVAETKSALGGFVYGNKYGPFIGSYNLPNGGKLMRHAREQSSGGIGSGNLMVEGTSYSLFYFKVDNQGIIRDWATGYYDGPTKDCMGISAFGMSTCKKEYPLQQFDRAVRTSSGADINSWLE